MSTIQAYECQVHLTKVQSGNRPLLQVHRLASRSNNVDGGYHFESSLVSYLHALHTSLATCYATMYMMHLVLHSGWTKRWLAPINATLCCSAYNSVNKKLRGRRETVPGVHSAGTDALQRSER